MGNHLNVGNQRIAEAAGFRISFLTKASEDWLCTALHPGDPTPIGCVSKLQPLLAYIHPCSVPNSPQLRSTKTTDNKSTLLHYLVRTIQKKFPELARFPDHLDAVAPAARGNGS